MFLKIYSLVTQLMHKQEKPSSKVIPVYDYYDYDYARLYDLV
jgi:hypothetical protein